MKGFYRLRGMQPLLSTASKRRPPNACSSLPLPLPGRAFSSSRVFIWGNGNEGQLGLGPLKKEGFMNTYDEPKPRLLDTVPLDPGETVVDLSCGQSHTLAVTSLGKLFSWGSPDYGKLGLGPASGKEPVLLPQRVGGALLGEEHDGGGGSSSSSSSPVKVVSACCGESHSLCVDDQGRLYSWGFGGSWFSGGGMLGHGDSEQVDAPKLVESLVADGLKVKSAAAGELHSALLTMEGAVLTCGAGEYGRLGNNGSWDVSVPTVVEGILDEEVVQLVSGHAFSLALTEAGRLWVWGRNDQGQLGQGGTMSLDVYSMQPEPWTIDEFEAPGAPRLASVAAGHSHAAAVTDEGELWMWGMKNYLSPKKFEVVDAVSGEPEVCTSVACGLNFTCVTTQTGRVYTFGNKCSALGQEESKRQPQPVLVDALDSDFFVAGPLKCGHRHVAALARPKAADQPGPGTGDAPAGDAPSQAAPEK